MLELDRLVFWVGDHSACPIPYLLVEEDVQEGPIPFSYVLDYIFLP